MVPEAAPEPEPVPEPVVVLALGSRLLQAASDPVRARARARTAMLFFIQKSSRLFFHGSPIRGLVCAHFAGLSKEMGG